MESLIRNVKDLKIAERRACEELLGHGLVDDQQLIIHVVTLGAEPTAEERDRALDRLQQLMSMAERNALRTGLSHDEIGRIIDDAIADVRSANG